MHTVTTGSGSPDGIPFMVRSSATGATTPLRSSSGASSIPLCRHFVILAPALMPTRLHGVKFLLGAFDEQSVAEVRIDGVRHDASSVALLKLPWPKAGKRVARFFVMFIHAE